MLARRVHGCSVSAPPDEAAGVCVVESFLPLRAPRLPVNHPFSVLNGTRAQSRGYSVRPRFSGCHSIRAQYSQSPVLSITQSVTCFLNRPLRGPAPSCHPPILRDDWGGPLGHLRHDSGVSDSVPVPAPTGTISHLHSDGRQATKSRWLRNQTLLVRSSSPRRIGD